MNVTKNTLYAYVSRGMIRSEPVEGKGRAHRYRTADVIQLIRRKEVRRDPDKAASPDRPPIPTALTEVTASAVHYRGRLAYDLSATGTARTGWRILHTGVQAALADADAANRRLDVIGRLSQTWNVATRPVLEAALILSADHAMDASALAVRCAASDGASLYSAVSAGLGAPLTLFALGRLVGWIGHAREQCARDTPLQPETRFVG